MAKAQSTLGWALSFDVLLDTIKLIALDRPPLYPPSFYTKSELFRISEEDKLANRQLKAFSLIHPSLTSFAQAALGERFVLKHLG